MDLVLRATVIFFVIWMVTRVVGRRELSSMEPFDLILLIVIGDMVQGAVTQSDQSVTGALVVIFTLSLLTENDLDVQVLVYDIATSLPPEE